MKYSILNEGVTLKAQSGAILKTAKQLEALAKETAFADMIKEGMPIYKASEVLKTANNLETIPYNEYQGFTTAGRLKSMDFNVGNESAFDNALSDKRAINNEIVRTNRKIQNLQNEIADYTQKHKELSDNLNLLRASGLKAHKIDGRNKSRLNWFNEQFNYDNHSDLEQLQYYDLWINRMKDEIKSLSANIPTSLFESGGVLKAQSGLSNLVNTIKNATKTNKLISVAERLGIPKNLRNSSNAIANTYYWGYPQWNAAYNRTLSDGDYISAQRLRDLHFKLKSPDNKVVDKDGYPLRTYHFTRNPKLTNFNEKPIAYFTSNRRGESIYDPLNAYPSQQRISVYLNLKNPAVEIDRQAGWSWYGEKDLKTFRISSVAEQDFSDLKKKVDDLRTQMTIANEHNDISLRNKLWNKFSYLSDKLYPETPKHFKAKQYQIYDLNLPPQEDLFNKIKSNTNGLIHNVADDKHYLVFDPTKIKSSNAITFDDNMKLIPIVKRDNFHNMDLRYKQGGVVKAQKGKVIKAIGEAVKGGSKPALVKYYAPTMGKTFAAKSNPLLVDFDDIIREPSRQILDTYGFKSKSDMYNSGNTDAISAYENMLVEKLNELRSNPEYNGKTVVVSPTAVANPDKIGFKYDNVPSIPVKSIFIERNVGRGGTPGASEMWYDSLMRQYPGFNIENRFVSELEPMPTSEQWDALYNAAVESGNKEEVDRLEQMFYDLKTPGNQTPGITYRGERFPKDAYKFTIGSEHRPGMMFTTTEPALASSYADLHTPYTKAYGLQKQLVGEENMLKRSEEMGMLTPELKEQWTEKINRIKASIIEAIKEQPDFSHYRFRRMRIYSTNPEVFDAKGSLWSRVKPYDPELGKIPTTDDLAIAAQKKGHDAMVIQNVRDSGNSTIFFGQNPTTDIVALDPNRVKLAGPTYDDNGKLIPLSKRFDFSNPDIRYGIIPLVGLGLGAAATQKEKNGGTIKSIF